MSDRLQLPTEDLRQCMDEESLRDWVQVQRWYASKSRPVAGIEVIEGVPLRDDPLLFLALVQTRFATGTHELYQLPLNLRPRGETEAQDADRDRRRLDRLRRPRAAGAAAGADPPHGCRGEARRRERLLLVSPSRGRQVGARRCPGAADGGRAVELLAGDRRPDRAEGLPQARARDQPRARAAALPHRPRLSEHRHPVRVVRVRRHRPVGDPGGRTGVRPRRRRRMGAGARAGA